LATAPAFARLLGVAAFFVLAVSLVIAGDASAQTTGIKAPAPAGTQWEVLAGYNTVTHEGVDPFALDIWRTDGSDTGGTPVLAPVAGEVGYSSSTCVSILTAEVDLMMCHIYPESGLRRGDPVNLGQRIGTVAPAGEAGNNGVAHIHFQLNVRDDEAWSSGDSLPFSGAYAIEGVNFEPITDSNGHAGRGFTSTNAEGPAAASASGALSAGPDRLVAPGETVTLQATGTRNASAFWAQQSGPTVLPQIAQGTSVSFVAPSEVGASMTFRLIVSDGGNITTDDIQVTVAASSTPLPAEPAPQIATGTIVDGEVFHGGISMVLFGGGSTDTLIQAIACPLPELAMWASAPDGRLVQYTVGRPAFVNASWAALFPSGLPELTPLLLKCS